MVALSRVPYFVSRKQQAFLDAAENFRGFCAGRSTGKTEIGVADLLLKAKPGEPYMVVSPTNGNLLDTTIPKLYRVAKRLGWTQVFNQRSCGPGRFYVRESFSPFPWAKLGLKGGSAEIIFRSGEEPDRLAGPSMAALWLDEASKMRKAVMEIGLPVLRHNGQWGRLTMTFTPRGTRHWTFGFFYEQVSAEEASKLNGDAEYIQGRWYRRRLGYRLIRSHSRENPFNPPNFAETLSEHYTKTLAAQEFGGEFVELSGLMFQEEWFGFQNESPRKAMRVRYWDRAGTKGAGDFSAGVLMAKADGRFYIEDVKRGQWSAMERNKIIVETARQDAARYNNEVIIYGEQEGGSAGKEISEQFIHMLAGFPVYRDVVSGRRSRVVDKLQLPGEAKIVRALPFAAQAEAGNVTILRRPWVEDLMQELCNFPESEHDDQVDCCSGAFEKLTHYQDGDPGEVTKAEIEPDTSHYGLILQRSKQRRGV